MLSCRALSESPAGGVLVADNAVRCDGRVYKVHHAVAWGVILLCVCVPLAFLRNMMLAAKASPRLCRCLNKGGSNGGEEPEDEDSTQRRDLLHSLEQDLCVSDAQARDMLHDLVDQQNYTFLTAGFRPAFSYWECIDMIRKLTMVGLGCAFGNGGVGQLFFTSILSLAWLAAQIKAWPYRCGYAERAALYCSVLLSSIDWLARRSNQGFSVCKFCFVFRLVLPKTIG